MKSYYKIKLNQKQQDNSTSGTPQTFPPVPGGISN